jgi:hypothetical protein
MRGSSLKIGLPGRGRCRAVSGIICQKEGDCKPKKGSSRSDGLGGGKRALTGKFKGEIIKNFGKRGGAKVV